jgi:hypothetical protein
MSNDLLQAARDADETQVRLLLEKGASVHAKNEDGLTSLLLAARRGHKDIVRLLLRAQADIEASDENGNTALLLATKSRHKEVIRLLLRENAEIEACDGNGRTALHLAAKLGDEAIVRLLVKEDANIDATDDRGNTPSMLAERAGHNKVIPLLQDDGKDDGDNSNAAWSASEDNRRSYPSKPQTATGSDTANAASPPYGQPRLSASADDTVSPWESATGAEFSKDAGKCAFSPVSQLLPVVFSTIVKIMEVRTRAMAGILEHKNQGVVKALTFSPDEQLLATVTGLYTAYSSGYC